MIVDSKIETYIYNYCSHLSPLLQELERQTYLKVLLPNMISSKEQGIFLYHQISMLNPKKVLEIGTFTGYATICMAMAMDEKSSITTIDINEGLYDFAKDYFEKSGQEKKIVQIIADASIYLDTIESNSLDFVFLDADKQNYPLYVQKLKSKIKKNGFLLIDNVLWHGKVVDSNKNNDTKAIIESTELMFQDSNFISNILPLRDGILMSKKINN